MNADSNMAPDNAMWNPPIKLPYLIHFCGKVQLVVMFWPNEASGAIHYSDIGELFFNLLIPPVWSCIVFVTLPCIGIGFLQESSDSCR